MIDLITVVFSEEIPILKVQAGSVARHCANIGIKNIYVVANDDCADQIDTAWWGQFAHNVRIVPRNVFGTEFVDNGWVSQQLLKLLAATLSYNTWSMVLDAKTVFVRDVLLDELMDNSRMCVGQLDIYPVFEPSRQIINNHYNIDLQKQLGPGGVPFLFHNSTVRSMVAEFDNFPQWFQAQGRVTEFMLYSGYLQYRYGSFETFYSNRRSFEVVNVCHSEVGIWDIKFKQMLSPKALTVSVHRHAWSQLSYKQQQQYRTLLSWQS